MTGPPSADERTPLSALMSQLLVAFTIEFDNEFEHRMPHRTTTYGWSRGRTRLRRPSTLPHYPVVTHRGGFPDGS